MPYVTSQQLTDRFGLDELIQITNPTDPTATAISMPKLDSVIADVDALINGKLQARYALPMTTVPLLLSNVACDLVRARLYDDRLPDRLADRERAALKLLDEMASGKVALGLDAAAQPTPVADGPQFTSSGRVFTADSLADY